VEQRPAWAEIVLVLVSTAATGVLVWYSMPPAQREMAVLSARTRAHRWLAVHAPRAGRAGMADELAGRDPAPAYGMAYRMATWRDRLAGQ